MNNESVEWIENFHNHIHNQFRFIESAKMMLPTPSILIVDDNEQNLRLMEEILDELKLTIVSVDSGTKAIEKVRETEFAIILLDIQMPELDGFQTIELIKESSKNKFTPIIFISAIYSDLFYSIKCIQSGAVDFISKPIISEILIGKIKVFIDLYIQRKILENYQNRLEEIVDERTQFLIQSNLMLQDEIKQRMDTEVKLRIAKEQAEESNRLKSAFLNNFSHEIRTPMNAITGFANLLHITDLPTEQRLEYVELINENSTSLLNLIDNIIEISQVESEMENMDKLQFDISFLVRQICHSFDESKKLINKEHIPISVNINKEDDGLLIFNSPKRIKQVLFSLIENALKFTDFGMINVGFTLEDDYIENYTNHKFLRFFVRGTGIGIEKEKHELVFDKFYTLNPNPSKLYRGAGIGLALSQKIIQALGGKIWLDSEPGKGATFYFTIPLQ